MGCTELILFRLQKKPRQFFVPPHVVHQILRLLRKHHRKVSVSRKDGVSVHPFINEVGSRSGYGACKLAAERWRAGMSQVYVAEATGMYRSHICAMENRRRPIGEIVAKRV